MFFTETTCIDSRPKEPLYPSYASDAMTDPELQADERLALTSIYDETVISVTEDAEDPGGQFLSCVHLPDTTIKILYRRDLKGSNRMDFTGSNRRDK